VDNSKEVQYVTERFLYYLKNIGSIMSELCQQKYAIEQELSDLSHELELSQLNASEMAKIASEQRRLLRERRVCKDELLLLQSFKDFQSSHDTLKYDLVKTVRENNEVVGMLRTRRYKAKVRGNLRCCCVG